MIFFAFRELKTHLYSFSAGLLYFLLLLIFLYQTADFGEGKYSYEKKNGAGFFYFLFLKDLAVDLPCQSHFPQPHNIKMFSTC